MVLLTVVFCQLFALHAARWGTCWYPINILSSGKESPRALLSIALLSASIGLLQVPRPWPWTEQEKQLFCVYRSGSRDRGVQKTTKNIINNKTTHEAFFKENLKGIAFLSFENGDVKTHSSQGGGPYEWCPTALENLLSTWYGDSYVKKITLLFSCPPPTMG